MASITEWTAKDGSTHYRARVQIKGRPAESATFTRKTDARKWAQSTEAAIREGRYFKSSEARKRTAGELIDKYILEYLPKKAEETAEHQKRELNWWRARIGAYHIVDVTPAVIAKYRDELLNTDSKWKRPRSTATVNRHIAALSHCFTIAVKEWHWADDNPVLKVRKPPEPAGRVCTLTREQVQTLLEACRGVGYCPDLHDYVLVLLCTGARRAEILNLTWDEVDFANNVLRLPGRRTKNRRARNVPLVGPARVVLAERSKLRRLDTRLVFPRAYTPMEQPRPIEICEAWRKARKDAGMPALRIHDLRHASASFLAEQGASLVEIAHILGHTTLAVTSRYTHAQDAHSVKLASRMTDAVFGAPDAGEVAE